MRFLATLSNLLIGASLTTSVLAAPRPIETQLERRAQNLDDDVEADKATWEYFAGKCGGGSSKRGLQKRADMVDMGKSKAYAGIPLALKTEGLKPCLGIAITGKKKDGSLFRILGHFVANELMKESQWQEFKKLYDGIGDVDKDTTTGWMSVPDYDKEYAKDTYGFYKTEKGEEKESKKLSKEFEGELRDRVDDLVDGNPRRFPRDVDSASTMEVNENNEVYVNGVKLES